MSTEVVAEPHVASPVVVAPERELRVLVVLSLATFLAVINFSASAPFFPQIARDLDTTVPLLGQVPTTITLLAALLGLGIGPIADRYGHRRLLCVGIIAATVNLLGTAFAPSFPVLLALAVAGGLADAILFGIPLALAGSIFHGDARRRAIAWASAALPAGGVLGVPALTLFGEVVDWRVVFLGAGITTLACVPLAVAWVPETRVPDRTAAAKTGWSALVQLLSIHRANLRHRPLLMLYAAGALRMAGWTGMTMYLGAYLADAFGFRPAAVSAAYWLSGSAVLIGSLAAGHVRRIPVRRLIMTTMLLQGSLLGLVFVLPLPVVAVLGFLTAASFVTAFGYVGLMTLTVNAAQASDGGTASAMVLAGGCINLGVTVGGAAGGALLAVGSWRAIGLGLPLFTLLAAAVLSRWSE